MLNQLLALLNLIPVKTVGGFIYFSKRKKVRFRKGGRRSQCHMAGMRWSGDSIMLCAAAKLSLLDVGFGRNFI